MGQCGSNVGNVSNETSVVGAKTQEPSDRLFIGRFRESVHCSSVLWVSAYSFIADDMAEKFELVIGKSAFLGVECQSGVFQSFKHGF